MKRCKSMGLGHWALGIDYSSPAPLDRRGRGQGEKDSRIPLPHSLRATKIIYAQEKNIYSVFQVNEVYR